MNTLQQKIKTLKEGNRGLRRQIKELEDLAEGLSMTINMYENQLREKKDGKRS